MYKIGCALADKCVICGEIKIYDGNKVCKKCRDAELNNEQMKEGEKEWVSKESCKESRNRKSIDVAVRK